MGTAPTPTNAFSTPLSGPSGNAQAPTQQASSKGAIFDTILHDVLLMGTLAASIFVKNPGHQQTAGALIQAANTLLQYLDPQLLGTQKQQ